jgi:hypothetical protein
VLSNKTVLMARVGHAATSTEIDARRESNPLQAGRFLWRLRCIVIVPLSFVSIRQICDSSDRLTDGCGSYAGDMSGLMSKEKWSAFTIHMEVSGHLCISVDSAE